MPIRSTHTYVILEITPAAFGEIAAKLRAAGYHHVFDQDGAVIDMQGIALQVDPAALEGAERVKLSNEYAQVFGHKTFDEIPKAVFAAIALSFANRAQAAEGDLYAAAQLAVSEWETLADNGIVPQRPSKLLLVQWGLKGA